MAALAKAHSLVSDNPVVVFSKSYCRNCHEVKQLSYCHEVKQLLTKLGAIQTVVELDVESDGTQIQTALKEWTGHGTVPSVFIGGKHIGGRDDTVAKNNSGSLLPLLREAGALKKEVDAKEKKADALKKKADASKRKAELFEASTEFMEKCMKCMPYRGGFHPKGISCVVL